MPFGASSKRPLHAPWILLVSEAGGAFTDHAGTTAGDYRGGLFSNGHVHGELLAALRPPITRLGCLVAPSEEAVQTALSHLRPDLADAATAVGAARDHIGRAERVSIPALWRRQNRDKRAIREQQGGPPRFRKGAPDLHV